MKSFRKLSGFLFIVCMALCFHVTVDASENSISQPLSVPQISSDGNTVNINLVFAQLQQELAAQNKDQAMQRIEGIRESQEESAEITKVITDVRNIKTECFKDGTQISAPEFSDNTQKAAEKYGITLPDSQSCTDEDLNNIIQSLQDEQEKIGYGVQQEMVSVQDFMGQYNSYNQSASNFINKSNDTNTAVATGRGSLFSTEGASHQAAPIIIFMLLGFISGSAVTMFAIRKKIRVDSISAGS